MLVLPTAYFGSISWYRQLVSQNEALIDGSEIFQKQTFRNRCVIATPQGISKLSIPVEKVNGPATKTADVLISNQKDWRKDHWRSLQSNYSSAPYFEHYAQEIYELIYSDERSLLKFNQSITEFILRQFGFEIQFAGTVDLSADNLLKKNFESAGPEEDFKTYQQVYFGDDSFYPNLSVLDLLFCIGPAGRSYLTRGFH